MAGVKSKYVCLGGLEVSKKQSVGVIFKQEREIPMFYDWKQTKSENGM